jgi:hypothetical protein
VLIDELVKSKERNLTVFDLGAGTGAIQIAVALVCCAMKELGLRCPELIRLVNIDSSPFMLDYNRSWLWKSIAREFPAAAAVIDPDYEVSSWQNLNDETPRSTWLAASYPFDQGENFEHMKSSFTGIAARMEPQLIYISTAAGGEKEKMISALKSDLENLDGRPLISLPEVGSAPRPFGGDMIKVRDLRSELARKVGHEFKGTPKWSDNRPAHAVLAATEDRLSLEDRPANRSRFNLFTPPLQIRRKIVLSESQAKAALPGERPTIIKGPAGCGKSVVITERIRNLVESRNNPFASLPPLKILLTSFNKGLIRMLRDWTKSLLPDSHLRVKRDGENPHYELEGPCYKITLMHFDVLPQRLGNLIPPMDANRSSQIGRLINALKLVREAQDVTVPGDPRCSDPAFLLDEFQRVIYAQDIRNLQDYLECDRIGRGSGLSKKIARPFVWMVINKYLTKLKAQNMETFITNRRRFLDTLRSGEIPKILFTHVFVDELQDCTPTDFQIFYQLIEDGNQLVFAGDLAQAIQIGATARLPKEEGQRNWQHFLLKGSYRLPYWVCRAIDPLSLKALGKNDEVDLLQAWKGAPPGARPIVVFGESTVELGEKIKELVNAFSVFEIDELTILEQDKELCEQLNSAGEVKVNSDSILRLKGLEKRCVIWSTRIDVMNTEDREEYVYTILTRTSSLLIIAIAPNTVPEFGSIMNTLNASYLQFWDKESKEQFEEICRAN